MTDPTIAPKGIWRIECIATPEMVDAGLSDMPCYCITGPDQISGFSWFPERGMGAASLRFILRRWITEIWPNTRFADGALEQVTIGPRHD